MSKWIAYGRQLPLALKSLDLAAKPEESVASLIVESIFLIMRGRYLYFH